MVTEHIGEHGALGIVVFFHCRDCINFSTWFKKYIGVYSFFLLQALIWHWAELAKLADGVDVWYKQKGESDASRFGPEQLDKGWCHYLISDLGREESSNIKTQSPV